MTEASAGVLTVLLLFAICMLLGFVVVFIKNKYQTPPKKQSPKIFYVTESKKPKRKPKKKITIPLEATVLKAEDLKKYLNSDK